MKKFLTTSIFALALLVGATGAASVAQAAIGAVCVDNSDCTGATETCDLTATPRVCIDGLTPVTVTAAPTAISAAEAKPGGDAGNNIHTDNSLGSPDKQFGTVMTYIMSLFAWLVGVAALTLDWAVYFTVVTMGNYVKDLSAIGLTWRILRDLGNIVLIFGFIAVGISIILNTERIGYGKKMLPTLLIVAVFLNFSLFISEAVIDVGNLFATQFYAQINGGNIPSAATLKETTVGKLGEGSLGNEGISNKIFAQLGFQSIYGEFKDTKGENTWIVGFLGIILFLIAAFVMFSLAFILIARFVILIFLIIVAPIGFAGLVIPRLENTAKEWWHKLFEQTITAPVLLLLLYVALAVITDAKFLTGICAPETPGATCTKKWLGFVNGNDFSGFASMLLAYIIAMALLMAVVMVSKRMSAFGAGWATKLGGKLSFGATAWAGRATLGSMGNALASNRMKRWGNSNNRLLRYTARTGTVLGRGLRSSTFDFRNMPGAAAGIGAFGVDAGKASAMTAQQIHDAKYGKKPVDEWLKHSAEERQKATRDYETKQALKQAQDTSKGTQEERDDLAQRTLSKMSNKEIEELEGIKKGVGVLVRNLSPEQFETLMKNDKFSETEKDQMKASRYAGLRAALDPATTLTAAEARKEVRQWSAKDLAYAAPNILQNPHEAAKLTEYMSEGQAEALTKNDRLTRQQQQQVKTLGTQGRLENLLDIAWGRPPRNAGLVTAGVTPAGLTRANAEAQAQTMLKTLTPKKLAKLPASILTDHISMDIYSPQHLAAMQTEGELDPSQISAIAQYVRNPAHPNHAGISNYLDPTKNPVADSFWQP